MASAEHPSMAATMDEGCSIAQNLTIGSRGDAVLCLQARLVNEKHLDQKQLTGYFGGLTRSALIKWQRAMGLPATGFFGARSREHFAGHGHMMSAPSVAPAEIGHAKAAPMTHAHEPIDVSKWPSVPSLEIKLHPDAMSGYNLEIIPTNFAFAPQNVNGTVLPNEGHAHLYIDGKKISRIYGSWYHIGKDVFSGAGSHEVLVTLNANDHSDLVSKVHIEAKASVMLK